MGLLEIVSEEERETVRACVKERVKEENGERERERESELVGMSEEERLPVRRGNGSDTKSVRTSAAFHHSVLKS